MSYTAKYSKKYLEWRAMYRDIEYYGPILEYYEWSYHNYIDPAWRWNKRFWQDHAARTAAFKARGGVVVRIPRRRKK